MVFPPFWGVECRWHALGTELCEAKTAVGWARLAAAETALSTSGPRPGVTLVAQGTQEEENTDAWAKSPSRLVQDRGAGFRQWVLGKALQVVLACSQGWQPAKSLVWVLSWGCGTPGSISFIFPPHFALLLPTHSSQLSLGTSPQKAQGKVSTATIPTWGQSPRPQGTSRDAWRHSGLSPLGRQWMKGRDAASHLQWTGQHTHPSHTYTHTTENYSGQSVRVLRLKNLHLQEGTVDCGLRPEASHMDTAWGHQGLCSNLGLQANAPAIHYSPWTSPAKSFLKFQVAQPICSY